MLRDTLFRRRDELKLEPSSCWFNSHSLDQHDFVDFEE